MIFEKPSLRTRVTFETGMTQLGGHAIYLAPGDIRLGERETVADIARNLARWVDMIVARTFRAPVLERPGGARAASRSSTGSPTCTIPARCSPTASPCSSDGGSSTACASPSSATATTWCTRGWTRRPLFGFTFALACPPGYEPDPSILASCERAGATIEVSTSVEDAVHAADVVYTDVWTSMGQEAEAATRRRTFAAYQVNEAVMRHAAKDAVVMHCLPAHRGEEITDDVLDGPQSIVFDQAENRLHLQKALMAWLSKESGR